MTKPKRRRYIKREDSTHVGLCTYISSEYPKTIYHSDASGIRLTMGQAVKLKTMTSKDKIPDLFIAVCRPRHAGLYIEVKQSPEKLYKINGQIKGDSHTQEQAATLRKLNKEGYMAVFAGGIDEGKKIIDSYMKGPIKYLHNLKDLQGL